MTCNNQFSFILLFKQYAGMYQSFDTIPTAIVFGLYNNVSQYDFVMAVTICVMVNTATGFLQPVFVLHKAGKLSGLWSLIKRMPSFTCYFRSGTRKSTQLAKGL